ncbi:hypothetical protein D3C71_1606870 [compost metagenome]
MFELATSDQPKPLADGKIDRGFMHLGLGVAGLTTRCSCNVLAYADIVLDWLRIQPCGPGAAMPRNHRLTKKEAADDGGACVRIFHRGVQWCRGHRVWAARRTMPQVGLRAQDDPGSEFHFRVTQSRLIRRGHRSRTGGKEL